MAGNPGFQHHSDRRVFRDGRRHMAAIPFAKWGHNKKAQTRNSIRRNWSRLRQRRKKGKKGEHATAIAIWAVVKTRLTFADVNVLRSY